MHFPSELDFTSFSLMILDKRINCTIPEDQLLHNIFTMEPLASDPDAVLTIEESEGSLKTSVEEKGSTITMSVSGEGAFDINCFRSYIGFLIHYLTPAMFLHASGIYSILKKKGILILGHKGSGKTTISREIPFAYIIDDDQILLEGNKLIGIGKKAAHTIQRKEMQNVVYEEMGYRKAELGLILSLTKDLRGGSSKKTSAESVLRDTSLVWHHNLSNIMCPDNYCEEKSIPTVPAYLIGTDEGLKETVDIVQELMDKIL